MAVCYDNLWKLLIDKKLKKTDLISKAKISTSALSKLGKNQYVSLSVIDKVREFLECDIKDVVTIKNKTTTGLLWAIPVVDLLQLFKYIVDIVSIVINL